MRAAIILLLAFLIGCNRSNEPRTLLAPDDVLLFTASATSVPASGFARVQLTARIDPRSADANRTITFRTTDGTLLGVGTSTENGKKLDVAADATGVATAELQSSTNVGSVIVTASVGMLVLRTMTLQFTPPAPTDIVRISVSDTTPPADGASTVEVYADIAPGLNGDQRNVTFTTTHGTFIGGTNQSVTIRAANNNRATADLVTPLEATSTRLTAIVNGVPAAMNLTFVPALPEVLTLDPSAIEMKATEEVTITAKLRRVPGKVTPGRIVTFAAVTDEGVAIGGFRNVTLSDSEEKATAVFSAGLTTYRRLVTIRATTAGMNGSLLTAQTTVRLTD